MPCHRYIQDCEFEISRVPSAFSWPGVSVFHPFFSWKWLQVINSTSSSARHCPAIFNEVDVAIQKTFTVTQFNPNMVISLTVTYSCPSVRAGHYCLHADTRQEAIHLFCQQIKIGVVEEICCVVLVF